MKLNQNHFGVTLDDGFPQGFHIQHGETKQITLKCSASKNMGGAPPTRPPILIQAGVKCNVDLFYFTIPVILQTLLTKSMPDQSLLQRVWAEVPSTPENVLTLPSMSPQV